MDHLSPDMNLALIQGLDSKTSQAAKKVKESNGDLDMAKIEETAREFEAVFIAEMMKPMFDGIKTDTASKGAHKFHCRKFVIRPMGAARSCSFQ